MIGKVGMVTMATGITERFGVSLVAFSTSELTRREPICSKIKAISLE